MKNKTILMTLAVMSLATTASARTLHVRETTGSETDFQIQQIQRIEFSNRQLRIVPLNKDSATGFFDMGTVRTLTFSPVTVGLITQKKLDKQQVFSWKTGDMLYVSYQAAKPENLTFHLYATDGKLLATHQIPVGNGCTTFSISLSELSKGTYTGLITDQAGKKTRLKFMR